MEKTNILLNCKKFTLIEIVIAIAILAIGVTSIMALFPLGLHSTKNAIAQNYSAFEAENIFAYLSRASDNNWSILNNITLDTKPNSTFTDTANLTKLEGNLWDDGNDDGRFVLQVQSNSVDDMTGEVLLWKKELKNYADTPVETADAYGIYMEISWPIEKAYDKRKKNYYYMELVKNE